MTRLLLFLTFSVLCLFACSDDEEFDPCEGIVCQNGGTCINGVCDCPEQRTGAACQDENPPSVVLLRSVTVTRVPAFRANGSNWDAFNQPDLMIVIRNERTQEVFYTSEELSNVNTEVEHTFDLSLRFDMPQQRYGIELYDNDEGLLATDDFMGGLWFFPYLQGQNFPTFVSLDAGSAVAYEIRLGYIW